MTNVRLRLLGPPVLSSNDGTIHLTRKKSLALLAYLAVERRAHSRDELATLLWPVTGQSAARKNLRQCLYSLREALGSGRFVFAQDTVELASGQLIIDVDEFRELTASCSAHARDEACEVCVANLERATEIYHEHLLTGFSLPDSVLYDEWQLSASESLRTELASALSRIVAFRERRDAWESSLRFARHLLSLDPLEERTRRAQMRLLVSSGQRVAALTQYRECVRLLEEELDTAREPETSDLHEKIRSRRYPSARLQIAGSSGDGGRPLASNGETRRAVCFVRADTHSEQVSRLIEKATGSPAGSWWGSLVGTCRTVDDAVDLATKIERLATTLASHRSGIAPRISVALDVDSSPGPWPNGTDYYHVFALLIEALDGETLLSHAIARELDGGLPVDYRVESIGVHRHADLGSPVEIYRLRRRDGPANDPLFHSLRPAPPIFLPRRRPSSAGAARSVTSSHFSNEATSES